jgi:hypothetical protein
VYTSALYLSKGMSFAATEPTFGKETELSRAADAIALAPAELLDAAIVLDAAGIPDAAAVLDVAGMLGVAVALDGAESALAAIVPDNSCAAVDSGIADAAT